MGVVGAAAGESRDIGILCPGPSLSRFLECPRIHDAYIGVNRAVEVWQCEYWSIIDERPYWQIRPQGHPVIWTAAANYDRISDPEKDLRDWMLFESVSTGCPQKSYWRMYSMTAAMVLAEHLGAKSITIHGCDWDGNQDWDGRQLTTDGREAYRWKNEIDKYDRIATWLRGNGVTVRRAQEQEITT